LQGAVFVMCVSCVLLTVCRLCCCCCFDPGANPFGVGNTHTCGLHQNLPLWAVYVCLQV
jgi:hypothetical protein